MTYGTMTNVDRIRERKDLPAIGYALCTYYHQILRSNHSVDINWNTGTYDEKYLKTAIKGIDELQINLTMNGRKVVLKDNPYATHLFKCWQFDPPLEFNLEDERFQVETKYQNISMAINRDLLHIVRRFTQDIYLVKPVRNTAYFVETIVITQLPISITQIVNITMYHRNTVT